MEFPSSAYQAEDRYGSVATESNSVSITRQRSRKISPGPVGIITFLLFTGIVVLVPLSKTQSGSTLSILSSLKEELVEEDVEIPVITSYNRYSVRDGIPGQQYEWLQGSLIAEPFQQTYFKVVSPNPSYDYEIKVLNSKTGEVDATGSTDVQIEFKNLQDRTVEVSVSTQGVQGEQVLVAETSQHVYVRYVRREIRALFDDDLEDLLDTMRVLWDVGQEEGEKLYGERYKSIIEMLKFHLKYAADSSCDHLHDGYGFITQHAAMTLVFEQSLQAVNPGVSLPYWEYVYDVEKHLLEVGVDFTDFTNSEMFTAKYFGATDVDTGHILDGRWAGLAVPFIWDLDLTPEEAEAMPTNAYGHLRSPWSNNADPQVMRSSTQCGADSSIFYTMPTCEILDTLQQIDNLADYIYYISYNPHGPIHIQTGGTKGCEEAYDTLEKYFDDKRGLDYLKAQSFIFHEGAYRMGSEYMVCTTKDKKCFCPLLDWYLSNPHIDKCDDWLSLVGLEDCHSTTDEFQIDLMNVICNSGLVEGDNSQSSSAYMPEFWSIHPTVERMWQKKRLEADFDDLTWPSGASWLPNEGWCIGHRYNDTVLMGSGWMSNSRGELLQPTNVEMLEMLSPFSTDLPYIYDNLKWDFCSAVGIDV